MGSIAEVKQPSTKELAAVGVHEEYLQNHHMNKYGLFHLKIFHWLCSVRGTIPVNA